MSSKVEHHHIECVVERSSRGDLGKECVVTCSHVECGSLVFG